MYDLIKKYKLYSLHLMVIILGFTGIFGKLITLDSLYLVWYRMLIACISLSLFLFYKNELFNITKRQFIELLGIGSIVTLHWIFFFESIKVSSVSVAVICLSTSSLFSAFIEPVFLKRKVIKYEVIMGFLVIIALSYMLGTDSENFLGYIYGILAAFSGTLFTLFNAVYLKKIDASKISMVEMLSGVIIISIIFIFKDDYTVVETIPTFSDSFYLIVLGILCTAMVFVWMTEIMRHISPYSLIMAINLEPIYSIILALLIFGDSEFMNNSFYIGSSAIILIVFLEAYLKNKQ